MAARKSVLNKNIVEEKLVATGISNPEEKIKELDKIITKYLNNIINDSKMKEDAQYDEAIS